MSKVKWRPEAIADVHRLHNFLKEKNPAIAARAVATIRENCLRLESFPRLGRPMHDRDNRREIFISFGAGSYVLRYVLGKNDVPVIIRVWHSREDRED